MSTGRVPPPDWRALVEEGYKLLQAERWEEALDRFETFRRRPVALPLALRRIPFPGDSHRRRVPAGATPSPA